MANGQRENVGDEGTMEKKKEKKKVGKHWPKRNTVKSRGRGAR